MKKDLSYDFFSNVDEETNLGKLFNKAFHDCQLPLMTSAPVTFSFLARKDMSVSAMQFYRLCLSEMYMHSIIENLLSWKKEVVEYNTEFNSSWKYYASAKRMDSIRQYGADEDDYNADGSIKTKVSNRILKSYSILETLLQRGWTNIFIDTYPTDMLFFCRLIIASESISINDVFRNMEKQPITIYRKEGDKMIACDWVDEIMMKTERRIAGEELADILFGVFVTVRKLIDEMLALKPTMDNKEFFTDLPGRIDDILNLRIEKVEIPGKEVFDGTF